MPRRSSLLQTSPSVPLRIGPVVPHRFPCTTWKQHQIRSLLNSGRKTNTARLNSGTKCTGYTERLLQITPHQQKRVSTYNYKLTLLVSALTSLTITSSRATISDAMTSAKEALSRDILRVSHSKVDQKLKVERTSFLR